MAITSKEEARFVELQSLALDSARAGDTAVLAPMLEAGLAVNLRDEKGNTLLMLASYHGHLETVTCLLKGGADPDARNDREQTPLAGVAFKGNLAMARLLVESGASPTADQGGGRTPAMFAALFGHPEMVAFLEERGGEKIRSMGLPAGWLARITRPLRRVFMFCTKR